MLMEPAFAQPESKGRSRGMARAVDSLLPSGSARTRAQFDAATRDAPQEQHDLFITTLRIWGLTLVILGLPAAASFVLRMESTGHLRLEASELRPSLPPPPQAVGPQTSSEKRSADRVGVPASARD